MISAQQLQKQLALNRPKFEDLVKRKFIYVATAEIYGGVAGLYDYGPVGSGLKNNLISKWKRHFIVEEDLLEISCTTLTPQVVLKHSGHEDRFADWMVKDPQTNESFRADHLLEQTIDAKLEDANTPQTEKDRLEVIKRAIPNFKTAQEFDKYFNELQITNPANKKNKLTGVYPFNLMFDCKIGPLGDAKAYLRPETAQSIFTNFKRLLEFKNGKLPFGGAMVGSAYRNEIAPRNGLLRVREFEMAEIEYFIDPQSKDHPKFKNVAHLSIPLLNRKLQADGHPAEKVSLEEAVKTGVIANEMLGYFIGRTYLFAKAVGLKEEMLRFRQHQSGEMAHYACDCWDLEVLSSFGWIECVGLADRSAYDLTAHMKGSGEKLVASRVYEKPISKQFVTYDLDKPLMGKTLKQASKAVVEKLEEMSTEELIQIKESIETTGTATISGVQLTKDMIKNFKIETKNVQEEKYVPNVIEPSFGLGRLIYCYLEQCFGSRDDDKRTFFAFNPAMATYKIIFLPLVPNKEGLLQIAENLETEFRQSGIMCKSDSSSTTIGKRYSRADEIGIPFAVTIDFQTLDDQTVTLRDILTMKQLRVPIADLRQIVVNAVDEKESFESLTKRYPAVTVDEADN